MDARAETTGHAQPSSLRLGRGAWSRRVGCSAVAKTTGQPRLLRSAGSRSTFAIRAVPAGGETPACVVTATWVRRATTFQCPLSCHFPRDVSS